MAGACSFLAASNVLAVGTVGGMVLSWVLMSELLQGMLDATWNKPYFAEFIIHAGYAIMIIPWAIMYKLRRRGNGPYARATYADFSVPFEQFIVLSLIIQALSLFNGYTWAMSLTMTLASANNAIYQSSTAFVFVVSVFLIGERVTARKIIAVCVCLTGVVLVSALSEHGGDAGDVHQSVAGYIWVIVSTVGYSVFEVVYARFTEQHIHSWRDVFKRGYMTSHAAAEHAEAKQLTDSADEKAEKAAIFESRAAQPAGGGPTRRRSSHGTRPSADEEADVSSQLLEGDGAGAQDSDRQPLVAGGAEPGAGSPSDHGHGKPAMAATPALRAEISAFMLGSMGIFTMLTMWPIFIIFHYTGQETFEWPPHDKGRILGWNVLLDSIYNVLLLFGIQISSPLFMSVGTMTVIPATMVADYIIHHATVGPGALAGMVMIVLGWLILQAPPSVTRWCVLTASVVSSPCRRPR